MAWSWGYDPVSVVGIAVRDRNYTSYLNGEIEKSCYLVQDSYLLKEVQENSKAEVSTL